jgi:hypothetical protein
MIKKAIFSEYGPLVVPASVREAEILRGSLLPPTIFTRRAEIIRLF